MSKRFEVSVVFTYANTIEVDAEDGEAAVEKVNGMIPENGDMQSIPWKEAVGPPAEQRAAISPSELWDVSEV